MTKDGHLGRMKRGPINIISDIANANFNRYPRELPFLPYGSFRDILYFWQPDGEQIIGPQSQINAANVGNCVRFIAKIPISESPGAAVVGLYPKRSE